MTASQVDSWRLKDSYLGSAGNLPSFFRGDNLGGQGEAGPWSGEVTKEAPARPENPPELVA